LNKSVNITVSIRNFTGKLEVAKGGVITHNVLSKTEVSLQREANIQDAMYKDCTEEYQT